MNNPFFAQPDTPVSTAAPYEDIFNKYDPDQAYFSKRALHLHFTWDDQSLVLDLPDSGSSTGPKLPEVWVGEKRLSKEGVLYRQLPTPNPNQLHYHVESDQFRGLCLIGQNQFGNGQYQLGDFEKGFDIVIDAKCPKGVLVVLTRDYNGFRWSLAKNRTGNLLSGCGGSGALGKPTTTPEFGPTGPGGSRLGNIVRHISTRLLGKNPIQR